MLEVRGLHASAGGREVLHGIDLTVRSGEVHVIMGPNGSGKSTLAHALMGRPGTEVTAGSIKMDGQELAHEPAWKRAQAGLFLALQHPVEVPGVGLHSLFDAALGAGHRRRGARRPHGRRGEGGRARRPAPAAPAQRRPLGRRSASAPRWSNSACCARPSASSTRWTPGSTSTRLGEVARRLQLATTEWGVGILAITHFNRFLVQLEADLVHVMVDGRIVATGDAALALQLEQTGYTGYQDTDG